MGRIEKDHAVEQEIAKLRGEVVKEISQTSRGRGKLSCAVVAVLVLVGLVCYGIWIVAQTGLVRVPVFSNFAFHESEPTRSVTPGVSLEDVIEQEIQSVLTRRLQSGDGQLDDVSVSIILDESSFTSSIQSALASSGLNMFDSSKVQVVVLEDEYIELFLPFKKTTLPTSAILQVEFNIVDNMLAVEVPEMRVGSFNVPRLLSDFFSQMIIEQQLSSLNESLGRYASVQELTYLKGRLMLNGMFHVEIVE